MSPILLLLLVLLRTAELRHLPAARDPQPGTPEDAAAAPAALSTRSRTLLDRDDIAKVAEPKRVARGAKDRNLGRKEPQPSTSHGPPPRDDGYFTTPRTGRDPPGNSSVGRGSGLLNPLFPVTEGSYWAYVVMLLALLLFAAGIVGNLALMCIVWHNVYLKSAWNCILAGLALWDFLVLFFCLPVVVFHELTLKRLLGDLSCRLVPYLEVRSETLREHVKKSFHHCEMFYSRSNSLTQTPLRENR